MPEPSHTTQSRRQIYEELRQRLGVVQLFQIFEGAPNRAVCTRNSGDRQRVSDAVRLDDVWQALEDVLLVEEEAETSWCGCGDSMPAGRSMCINCEVVHG